MAQRADRAQRHGAHIPAREAAPADEPARQRRARRACACRAPACCARACGWTAARRRQILEEAQRQLERIGLGERAQELAGACRWVPSGSSRSRGRWLPTRCCSCSTSQPQACAGTRSGARRPAAQAARRRRDHPDRRARHGLRHETRRPAGGDELRLETGRGRAGRGPRRRAGAGRLPRSAVEPRRWSSRRRHDRSGGRAANGASRGARARDARDRRPARLLRPGRCRARRFARRCCRGRSSR